MWLYRQYDGAQERLYRGEVLTVSGRASEELRARQADAVADLLVWAIENTHRAAPGSNPSYPEGTEQK